jgi:hypothetical protein
MTRFETYLRYQDVFGTASTFDQFEAELRSLDLGLVLRTFAAINVVCSRRGLPRDERTQVGLIQENEIVTALASARRLREAVYRLVMATIKHLLPNPNGIAMRHVVYM